MLIANNLTVVSIPIVVLILTSIAGLILVVIIIITISGGMREEEDLDETVGIDLIMEAGDSIAAARKPIV